MSDEIQGVEVSLTFIRDKAKEFAEAKANRVYLEQFRKSKKALLMNQAEREGITAAVKQEAYAYAHAEYHELLDGLRVAVERESYLHHTIEAAKLRIEIWRTENANQRAERRAYGA